MAKKVTYKELEKRVRELEEAELEYKRENSRLLKEKAFANSLVNTAQVIVLVLDTEGRIVRFNPYMEEISGYSLDEVKGKDWFSTFLPGSDHNRIRELFKQAIHDIQTRGQVNPIITKEGLERQIEWYDKTLTDHYGNIVGLLAIGQDISERMHAEEALLNSENNLRSVFEAAKNVSFIITDLKGEEAKIIEFSPGAEDIFGYNREEAIDMPVAVLHLEEDIKRFPEVLKNMDEKMEGFSGETTLVRKSGEKFPALFTTYPVFDNKGNIKSAIGVSIDITDLKTTEEILRKSEEKYRSMMDAMTDAAYITSSDFRIEYMNPKMIDRVGYDATGEFCHKAIYNYEEKCSWCVFDLVEQGEKVIYELADPKDNRYYSVSNSPIIDTDKSFSKLTVFHDISTTKAIEAQLRQARKMESIGTMAGGIAHDFNNILHTITGNAELAMEDIPEWNPVHTSLDEIKSAGLRAAGIVKQLLSFSRKTDQELKAIGAVTVIEDALKFLRSTIPTSIEIRKHLPDSEVTIVADPVQINQLLMNIFTNASQAMEETGGLLEITVENESLSQGVSCNTFKLPPGEYFKVQVSDTGPGIEPKIINRIFDPYFTTKDIGQGSGLGLAVVHGIVKNHHGAVTVASKLGKGTTFTFYFPISTKKPVREVNSSNKIPLGGDETILFVDDEKSIATMFGQMLERIGYQVVAKTNPAEVLERFKSNPDYFDLIITDMTMPQISGVKLSEILKSIRPDIPVIICTGHSSLIDDEKAKTLGIDGFVMKPIVLRDIARVIRDVLDEVES